MPLFFFDVRDDGTLEEDPEGQFLPSVTAAKTEARHLLGGLIAEGERKDVSVDVRDCRGERVCGFQATSVEVERGDPAAVLPAPVEAN